VNLSAQQFHLLRRFFIGAAMKRIDRISPQGEKEIRQMTRRELLKLLPLATLGAAAIPGVNETLLKAGASLADRAGERLYRPANLATSFRASDLTPLEKFPVNNYSAYDPANDLADWTLEVEGMVARPGEYTMEAIKELPKQTQIVRHICIEGWDVIGEFAGARLADFLQLVGVDPAAKFVEVSCLDDYYSSYDIASCLHPQTLLCYEMYGQALPSAHGAPLRIHMPVKLGYKSAKYVYSMRVSNVLGKQKGFWEDQGYSWYGGV
jgi:DMSO/TMAO reductase YedYZ molybdopterin-dependent catalytic subunit